MKITWHHSKDNDSRELVILLPGIRENQVDFQAHGFIDVARKKGLTHDFLSVDANVAYLIRVNLPKRFMADVITLRSVKRLSVSLVNGYIIGRILRAFVLPGPSGNDRRGVILISPYTGVNRQKDPMYRILQFIDRDHPSAESQQVPYTYRDRLPTLKNIVRWIIFIWAMDDRMILHPDTTSSNNSCRQRIFIRLKAIMTGQRGQDSGVISWKWI